MLTNALVHGAAPQHLFVYPEGPMLVCHVRDHGRGFTDPLAGYLPPDQARTGGRGLWIAHQTSDAVEVGTTSTGTHVRLLTVLDGTPGWRGS